LYNYTETFIFQSNTISQSLGISLTDVDFGLGMDVPSWRTNSQESQYKGEHRNLVKSDVAVTLSEFSHEGGYDTSVTALHIGTDTISKSHKNLLVQLKRGPTPFKAVKKKKAVPLFLDRLPNPEIANRYVRPLAMGVKWDHDIKVENVVDSTAPRALALQGAPEPRQKQKINIAPKNEHFNRVTSTRNVNSKPLVSETRTKTLETMFGSNVDVGTLANVLSDISEQIVTKQDVKAASMAKPLTGQQVPSVVDNTIFQTGW